MGFEAENPLPQIPPEVFENIAEKVQKKIDQVGEIPFTTQVFNTYIRRENPQLFNSLDFSTSLFAEDGAMSREETLLGAAKMYTVLTLLTTSGYPMLRRVSPSATTADLSEMYQLLTGFLANTPLPEDDEETLNTLQQVKETKDIMGFTQQSLFQENPAFKPWMESMNYDERGGAFTVYQLIRRQARADQLNNLFGDQ